MIQRLRKLFVDFWIVLAFGLAAVLLDAAGACGHDRHRNGAAQDERVRVKAMLERPELAKGLEKMGSDADGGGGPGRRAGATARCFSSPASSTPRSRRGRSATRRCC